MRAGDSGEAEELSVAGGKRRQRSLDNGPGFLNSRQGARKAETVSAWAEFSHDGELGY